MPETSNAKSVKKNNDKKAAAGRAAKQRFEQTKERVWKYEKKNRDKLIAFRSTDNWWKLGGTSALVYKNVLAPRLEKEPVLRDDTDFFSIFSDGIISIADIKVLKADLEKLGLEKSNETDEWVSYDLGWKISGAEIKHWREAEQAKKEKLIQMLMPKVEDAVPKLWVELMLLMRIAYDNVRKEQPAMRDYQGVKMLETVEKMVQAYVRLAKGEVERKELLEVMREAFAELKVTMLIVIELRAWEVPAQARFTAQMEKVEKMAEEKLTKEKPKPKSKSKPKEEPDPREGPNGKQ